MVKRRKVIINDGLIVQLEDENGEFVRYEDIKHLIKDEKDPVIQAEWNKMDSELEDLNNQ